MSSLCIRFCSEIMQLVIELNRWPVSRLALLAKFEGLKYVMHDGKEGMKLEYIPKGRCRKGCLPKSWIFIVHVFQCFQVLPNIFFSVKLKLNFLVPHNNRNFCNGTKVRKAERNVKSWIFIYKWLPLFVHMASHSLKFCFGTWCFSWVNVRGLNVSFGSEKLKVWLWGLHIFPSI